MKLARAWLSSVGVVGVGCAAVAGFEPLSFEPDGAAPDGGADVEGPSDSSLDGGADAKPMDAGRDSRAPIGCAADPGHDFCDDFSETLLFDAGGWTSNPTSGAAVTLTRDQEALLNVLPSADSGAIGSNALELVRSWTKQASGLRPPHVVRARLLVEECPYWATFMRAFRCKPNERYCVAIQLIADRGQCYSKLIWQDDSDGGALAYQHLPQPTALGEWHDVAVIVEESANGSTTLTYEIDGQRSGAVVDATNGTDELLVGVGIEGPQMGGRFRIDDLRVDWTAH